MSEGGKSSKRDRTRKSAQNLRYKNEKRHEKSHARRIRKHIARYSPNGTDEVAAEAIKRYAAYK